MGCHCLQGHSSLLTSLAQRLATSVSVRQNLPACHTCVVHPPSPPTVMYRTTLLRYYAATGLWHIVLQH